MDKIKIKLLMISLLFCISCEKKDSQIDLNDSEPQIELDSNEYFIAGAISSNINYFDINPDILLLPELNNCPAIFIDLFNDNTWDILLMTSWEASHSGIWEDIYVSNYSTEYLEITIDTNLSELNYYGRFSKVFKYGDTINNDNNVWVNLERVFLNSTYNGNTIGPWINQENKYIGTRNIINQDTIYSWVRFSSVDNSPYALVCHDYGYMKKQND